MRKNYYVECVFTKDYDIKVHIGSYIGESIEKPVGYICTNKIIIKKYFYEYDEAVKYIINKNFDNLKYRFIQDDELFHYEYNYDFRLVCKQLRKRGFELYFSRTRYCDFSDSNIILSKYFKKKIDEDFTQYICVSTMDGIECNTDTELFDIADY